MTNILKTDIFIIHKLDKYNNFKYFDVLMIKFDIETSFLKTRALRQHTPMQRPNISNISRKFHQNLAITFKLFCMRMRFFMLETELSYFNNILNLCVVLNNISTKGPITAYVLLYVNQFSLYRSIIAPLI